MKNKFNFLTAIIFMAVFFLFFILMMNNDFSAFFALFFVVFFLALFGIIFTFIKNLKNYKDTSDNTHDSSEGDLYNTPFDNVIKSNFGNEDGKIVDRYTDIKNNDMVFIVEVLDTKFNQTFLVKLSKEDYQKTYIGQMVKIKRGIKKQIIL